MLYHLTVCEKVKHNQGDIKIEYNNSNNHEINGKRCLLKSFLCSHPGFLVLWSKSHTHYITPAKHQKNSTSVTSAVTFYSFHTSDSIPSTGLQMVPKV